MSSKALASLITFLTRPLASRYPMSTVLTAQLALEANLSHLSLPFNLTLSSSSSLLPLSSIIDWPSVFGNQPLHFVVTRRCVTVTIDSEAKEPPSLVIWVENIEDSSYVPCISKKVKRAPSALMATTPIRMPKLPTTCLSAEVPMDLDSDSESDSSSFSFSSSTSDSMTSVSSRSSSPISRPSKYSPPQKIQKPSITRPLSPPLAPQYLSRKHHRTAPNVPRTKNADNSNVTKYLYQGGSTNVMTGGVMLGHAKPSSAHGRKKSVLLGPESNNWRTRN